MQIKILTNSEIDKLSASMELDLIAMFGLLQDNILGIIHDGGEPEDIISKIDKLFGEPSGSHPVQKAKAPIGHVSHRADGDYKKISEGEWIRLSEGKEIEEKPLNEKIKADKERYENYNKLAYGKKIENEYSTEKGKERLDNVSKYSSIHYVVVNDELLGKPVRPEWEKESKEAGLVIKSMDSYIKDYPLKSNLDLFRGAKSDDFKDLKVGDSFTHKTFASFSTSKDYSKSFLYDNDIKGTPMIFKMEARRGEPFAPALAQFKKRKDDKAVFVDEIRFNTHEQEFVGARNAQWEILSKENKTNKGKQGDVSYIEYVVRIKK